MRNRGSEDETHPLPPLPYLAFTVVAAVDQCTKPATSADHGLQGSIAWTNVDRNEPEQVAIDSDADTVGLHTLILRKFQAFIHKIVFALL